MLFSHCKGRRGRASARKGLNISCCANVEVFTRGDRTFHAIGNKDEILAKLEEVAAELEEDMERTGWTGKTITLKYKLDTYQGRCLRAYFNIHFSVVYCSFYACEVL